MLKPAFLYAFSICFLPICITITSGVACFQTADAELPLHPCVTHDGSQPLQSSEQLFKVFVDKVVLFEADDLTQAVTSLFAAYWLFGIKYNTKLWNFLSFLEVYVFRLKETAPRPPVIKLMKLLQ